MEQDSIEDLYTKKYRTVKKAADILLVREEYIINIIKRGKLQAYEKRGRFYIRTLDVAEFPSYKKIPSLAIQGDSQRYTVPQVAEIFDISNKAVYLYAYADKIKYDTDRETGIILVKRAPKEELREIFLKELKGRYSDDGILCDKYIPYHPSF